MISQCPSHIETTAPRNGKIIWWPVPTAWDVSGNVTTEVSGSQGGPGSGFPLGLSMVHYDFTDGSGNRATCTFEVNITGRKANTKHFKSFFIKINLVITSLTLV